MSGHVFHPGHEELHGITVVIDDGTVRTVVGRYHEATPRGYLLHDAAIWEAATQSIGREDWIRRQLKFGVQVAHRTVVIPTDSAGPITRLAEFAK